MMSEATAPLGDIAHGEAPLRTVFDHGQSNGVLALRLSGRIDREVLQRTLDAILSRHQILSEGRACQSVCISEARHDAAYVASVLAESAWIEAVAREETERSFALADVLLRASLLLLDDGRTGHHEAVLFLVLDASVSDAWSIALLHYEFMALYEAFSAGGDDPLPALSMQYADHRSRLRAESGQARYEDALGHWLSRLAGYMPGQDLPVGRLPAATHDEPFDASLRKRLMAVARAYRTNLFALLHAAFAVLLHRQGGQDDILIGVPVSGRTEIEFEPVIGRFAKSLLLRTRLRDEMLFSELLQVSHAEVREAYRFQGVPFDALLEKWRETSPQRPLPEPQAQFSICGSWPEPVDLPGLQAVLLPLPCHYASSPLELRVCDAFETFELRWTFATQRWDRDAVAAMSAQFLILLEGISYHPARPISALSQPVTIPASGLPSLPLIDYTVAASSVSAAPSTSTERALARIWAENLHIREELIGVTDSYFDIGGDSLRTITLASVIRDTLQANVSIADIFSYPTIQKLARHIANGSVQSPISRADSADSKNRILRARKHMPS